MKSLTHQSHLAEVAVLGSQDVKRLTQQRHPTKDGKKTGKRQPGDAGTEDQDVKPLIPLHLEEEMQNCQDVKRLTEVRHLLGNLHHLDLKGQMLRDLTNSLV